MEEAIEAFCQVYVGDSDIDTCIVELKQKGFSQLNVINALVIVLDYDVVDADRIVKGCNYRSGPDIK